MRHESEANLLGVVFTPAGAMTGAPYRVVDATHWVFAGTGLKTGDIFGEKSLHMRCPGGASGHETDKVSPSSRRRTRSCSRRGSNPDDGGAEMVDFRHALGRDGVLGRLDQLRRVAAGGRERLEDHRERAEADSLSVEVVPMKITRIEAIPVCVPLKKGMTAKTAHGEHVTSPYVIVKVHTDAGVGGLRRGDDLRAVVRARRRPAPSRRSATTSRRNSSARIRATSPRRAARWTSSSS